MVARAAAQQALERDEREREPDEHGRELERGRAVERAVPDAVDRVGHRAVAEEVDGAEVGQRLHHRERRAGGERRAARAAARRGGPRVAWLSPSVRAASNVSRDCSRNAARPST